MKNLNNHITFLKNNFETLKQESSEKYEKNISEIVDLEKAKKELENIVFKVGQSAQTMHMLTKPQNFYVETHKTALGHQNPLYIFQARRKQPALYNRNVLIDKHNPVSVCDYEETLILVEESQLKMLEKQTVFDECIKRRTTLSPHEIGSWEQSDIKEMKDIFEQMEDEVDQCSMAKKYFEIEKKQLLINNDRLLEENIASDIMCTYLRLLNKVDNCGKLQLKGKFSEPQMNQNGTSVNTKLSKPSTLGTKLYSVTPLPKSKVIPKVVEKIDLSKLVTSHLNTKKIIKKRTKVLAPSLLKIQSEPINAYFKNNKTVHRDYLKVTKDHVATLQELLEEARALKPLDEHIDCNADVKNVALSKNSDTICLSCNECLFSANHDACVVKYLKKMQKRKVAKSAKQKVKIGRKTVPPSSSSNDTSAIVVPPGHILTTTVIPVDVPCPKLSLRYANARGLLSKCMLNTKFHPFNLHDFGFEGIIRDDELPPWKFDYLGIVEIILWYIDFGCSKHMTEHRDKLINFVSKFIGMVRFDNDHFAAIMGYRDLQMGNILISRVYYVEGLGVDLLSGYRGSNLYTISMVDMMKASPIYLLSKASKTKSWLWHRRLFHLNFGTINQLAKQGLVKEFPKLKYTKYHLCSACQMGKKQDGISSTQAETNFTWVKVLRTKDEALEIIIKILKQAHVSLNATVRYLCTDNGTEFLNQTLPHYTEDVGITHHTSTVRTPQQNGVVERRNRTLVEAVRTMLIFSKSSLFLWAEAVATACYTQNRSLIHTCYNKTPYELLRDCKSELKHLHVFGALCYPTNDFKDLGKLQPKADIGIFIGYSPSKKAYQIYNKRTKQIMETMNVQFDELTQMASKQLSSGPDLHGLTSGHISSGLVLNQAASKSAKPPIKNEWDLCFNQYISRASFTTTIDQEAPPLSNSPNIKATNSLLNSTNVKPHEEVAESDRDTFTNPFAPPDTNSAE
ncbi:retrovirus-related pol polyprotein from transposon TNT 1-94 [Tanacetum coccineum]